MKLDLEELEYEYPQVSHLINFNEWQPTNVLGDVSAYEKEDPYMWTLDMMSRPENFYFTCKHLFGFDLAPFQLVTQEELWNRSFPMLLGTRGFGKSSSLGIYCFRRALFEQGCKIALVGLTFRQAKVVFETCEKIWNTSPIIKDMFGRLHTSPKQGPSKPNDRWELRIGESLIFAIPTGNGEGIRGQRANYIIVDEFASMPKDIYEIVIKGFSAVSANPIESLKTEARIQMLKRKNLLTKEYMDMLTEGKRPNQIIVSGTASFRFNNFYKEWNVYHKIIESKGDRTKLVELLGEEGADAIDWRDFGIVRVPYDILPVGFLEKKVIGQAIATSHTTNVQMEYGTVFPEDSDGFFRSKTIEACTTNEPININGVPVQFFPTVQGEPGRQYVMGIDPASQNDNFAIVIIEVHDDHRRVVYCWTTRQKIQKSSKGSAKGFYRYCADKVRKLMKAFSCDLIAIDIAGGGGVEIIEQLADEDNVGFGELPIFPITPEHILHDGKDKYECYDDRAGLHIIYPFSPSNYELVRDANHGMKQDFETQTLLMPCIDSIEVAEALAISVIQDEENQDEEDFDSLEGCIYNLEQLKEELCSIVVTMTPQGTREHWDISKDANKKTNKKDRYSALMMANGVARMVRLEGKKEIVFRGCMNDEGSGPAWYKEGMRGMFYGN